MMSARRTHTDTLRADDIVSVARSWIGTPYHHQASQKRIGTDCLGLVRGVFRELYGFEAEIPPAYTRDWAEASRKETLIDGARRHLRNLSSQDIQAGRVILFRIKPSSIAKHTAIATTSTSMIHAMEGVRVSEIEITPWWQRRVAGVFAFPGAQI